MGELSYLYLGWATVAALVCTFTSEQLKWRPVYKVTLNTAIIVVCYFAAVLTAAWRLNSLKLLSGIIYI